MYRSALFGLLLPQGAPLGWQVEAELARETDAIHTGGNPLPVIVFSHGSTNDPIDYAHTLERIAGSGFVVVAPYDRLHTRLRREPPDGAAARGGQRGDRPARVPQDARSRHVHAVSEPAREGVEDVTSLGECPSNWLDATVGRLSGFLSESAMASEATAPPAGGAQRALRTGPHCDRLRAVLHGPGRALAH